MEVRLYCTVVFLVLVSQWQCQAVNCGVKIRLTDKGIRFIGAIASKQIEYIVRNLKIKDIEGNNGGLYYKLRNTEVKSAKPPKLNISLSGSESGGGEITVVASDLAVNLATQYDASYRLLNGSIQFPISGYTQAQLDQIQIVLKLSLSSDYEDLYQPVIKTLGCNVNIKTFNVVFNGDFEWLLNLIRFLFSDYIKTTIQEQICRYITKAIDVNAANKTKNIQFYSVIADSFVIDYGYTSKIELNKDYMEARHSGEVYWKLDKKPSPYVPSELPEFQHDNSSMVYFLMSDYTPKTLAYTAQSQDYLQYTLTRDKNLPGLQDLNRDRYLCNPRSSRFSSCLTQDTLDDYLRTSCPDKQCVGCVIKEIEQRYPNTDVAVAIRSYQVPDIVLTAEGLAVTLYGSLNLDVKTNDTVARVLNIKMVLNLNGTSYVEGNRLAAKIQQYSYQIKNLTSIILQTNVTQTSEFVSTLLDLFLIPQVKRLATFGLPLFNIEGTKLERSNLTHLNGSILVSTDVSYKEEDYLNFFP
ncbi:uncharacterized protein LOC106076438 precursor [Biomphalaria glabrata]|uniref:LBP/BPI2 n=1 Tax=Biomphalaria glabrata TaxID=6526 RepID=A0A0G3Z6C7_BIOGL|nr:uncharacterized protein LOC106076438 precursor [Biomphalaria glabrata]AKM45821.1 LBP/BPI2 [Biomphalaria glabrata]